MNRLPICSLIIIAAVAAPLLQYLHYAANASNNKTADSVDEPMKAGDAAARMKMPAGFNVTVFAAEPDVRQPIGMCIDDRGRIWIAENYSYPVHSEKARRDRILILEDTDGDGRHDKRTVFYDKLNYVTGVEVGFGGAWVMSPPHLFFIPDRDRDDKPDSKPQVVLDGFGNHANAHNIANGFSWGPDGWLYGTHGRTNWSMIGKPGTPKEERIRFDGGVYRYHPVRRTWEAYADGCTNPWGIDWDDYGQGFIPNTVNPHLFHAIQGAHYEPWRNRESSRFAYRRIATIADHLHFAGGGDVRAAIGSAEESALGGGHSHCGIMVYLGDSWPDKYRNTAFMHNTHGRRVNRDILQRAGSGYRATHGDDFMLSADDWFMGVSIQYGPDGSAFATDWSDTGECHSVRNTRRETGRVYRISYEGGAKKSETHRAVDVAARTDDELVGLQLHRNDWFVRHARRVLQERAAAGSPMDKVHRQLRDILDKNSDVKRKLRALWTLHVTGGDDEQLLTSLMAHSNEYLRAWAIRLLCEDGEPSQNVLDRMATMARKGKSQLVRLHLASALQRLPLTLRWPIARALAGRVEDANDQNLPFMVWYGIEPLVHEDIEAFARLVLDSKIPAVTHDIARRIGSLPNPEEGLTVLADALINADTATRSTVLRGMAQGMVARRKLKAPKNWSRVVETLKSDPEAYRNALAVSLLFNDPTAVERLQRLATNTEAPVATRTNALQQLTDAHPAELDVWLVKQLEDEALQRGAIRGLARYANRSTPSDLLKRYPSFDEFAKQDALQTLASRPRWAKVLLDSVDQGRIDRRDLTSFTIRQIDNLNDKQLSERVRDIWGRIRPTSNEKKKVIAKYRKVLSVSLAGSDLSAGRALFAKHCGNCHKLFDAGGDRGPDITGAQRNNLDYLLENMIDPSGSVARAYQMHMLRLANGQVVTGLLGAETETTLTIRTLNEDIVTPKSEIEQRSISPQSLMPEKLLDELSKQELRNLVAYLQSIKQSPLPSGFKPPQDK